MMRTFAAGVLAVCVSGGLAFAQGAPPPAGDPQKVAEEEFMAGDKAYNLGRFDEAVEHFTKAYEAWPQAEFLYNIAQSYRLGGNCKQAVYFYKRFRSLKEKDTAAPISPKKREEVDKFINELSECAAKADTATNVMPQSLDRPPGTGTTGTTTTTAQKEPLESEEESEEVVEEDPGTQAPVGAKLVSTRAMLGVAMIGGGENLEFPVQPSFGISGGYPLPAGPAIVEVGGGLSYSPLPYETPMGEQKQGAMFGIRAQGVGMYSVAPKVWLRGELGLGILSLSGLAMGNPLTTDRSAGSFTLFNVRFGVAADYEITPNIVATVQPFAIAYSPGSSGMYADSLREIDVLFGVGYRK
jgi:hypothetical protein